MTTPVPLALSAGGAKTVRVGRSAASAPTAPGAPSGQRGSTLGSTTERQIRKRVENILVESPWPDQPFGPNFIVPFAGRNRFGSFLGIALASLPVDHDSQV